MAVEHVVEERVARVAVVGLVAAEALGHEQQRRQLAGRQPASAASERVELREARVDVEVGVRVRGDEQRGLVERDLGLRARHELGETLGRTSKVRRVAPFGRIVSMSGLAAPSSEQTSREAVAARLHRVGQRLTANRQALLDALTAAARPLTIPEILDRRPDLAQSSVYRNLVVLEEAGRRAPRASAPTSSPAGSSPRTSPATTTT